MKRRRIQRQPTVQSIDVSQSRERCAVAQTALPLRYTRMMTQIAQIAAGIEPALPSSWAAEVEALLSAGERTQAWVEIDLDAQLHFAAGLVLVTDKRLLARAPGAGQWNDWPLRAGLRLNHADHAGVGMLELVDERGRSATIWPPCASSASSTCTWRAWRAAGRSNVRSRISAPGARPRSRQVKTNARSAVARRPRRRRRGRCSAFGASPAPTAGNFSAVSC